MKVKFTLAAFCLCSSYALASDSLMMPRAASDYVENKSYEIEVEYDTRYDYHGMPVTSHMDDGGVFMFKGLAELPLSSDWSQVISGSYYAFCDGWLSDTNSFNASWGAKNEILPNLYFTGSYDFLYGGLPGSISKWRGKAPHSLAQAFTANFTYSDSGRNAYISFDTQYGFYGLTGWRFDLEVGKRFESIACNGRMDAVLSAATSYSSGYWYGGVTGFDEFGIKFAVPIRVSGVDREKGFQITPFIQTLWGGCTGSRINRRMGAPIIDSFDLNIGVSLKYSF